MFFSYCDYLNEGKYAFLSIAIIIFPENIIQKTIYASALYFSIGILAKVFIEEFYYNILRVFEALVMHQWLHTFAVVAVANSQALV